MEQEKSVAVTETPTDVPEGVRRARAAFLRDIASLLADPTRRGTFVCYHRDALVAAHRDYTALVREVTARQIPTDESLIFEVVPAAEAEERAIADESELP
jgi:hypothetical protein